MTDDRTTPVPPDEHDLDTARTHPGNGGGQPAGRSAADAEAPPHSRRVGRFEVAGELGRGGMGRVLRARDPKLERWVALKLIRGDDPALVARFQQEARAQARVHHPHVCGIYEVGEADGRPYIAMELLDGRTLDAAAREMTVQEIAAALHDVAGGVEAAHRTGLVHRDLKPSNIMVSCREDGWWAWVTDFGLARDVEGPGLTLSGTTLGTPAYMPPEQARGSGDSLDARADVYALGATLYAALAGRAPFIGESTAEIIFKVLGEEPVGLRRLGLPIPRDLESIVTQCLEKDPARRYPTAAALAADLARFLHGEPVEARRAGPVLRTGKWIRRHRALASVAVAALAVTAVLGASWWRTGQRARARAAFTAAYADEVRFVEEAARHAFTAPLHDVRPELAAARDRLLALERRVAADGELAVGPGAAALGRGYLALHDPATARAHLEHAWSAGARDPEVAAALGRTLATLYRQRRGAARWQDAAERDRVLATARSELRDPALEMLGRGRDVASESPELTAALLASCEERWDDAVEQARAASQRLPWLYQARVVEGDAWREIGRARGATGDAPGSLAAFADADAALEAAADTARSDPTVYQAQCDLGVERAGLALFGAGGDLAAIVEHALPDCAAAASADPGRADADLGMSALWVKLAEQQVDRGEDAEAALDHAAETARRALAKEPDSSEPESRLGGVAVLRAQARLDAGEDPTSLIDDAVELFQRALARDPARPEPLANMGKAHWLAASWARRQGGDPRSRLALAADAFRRAAAADPTLAVALNNLGATWYQRAAWEIDHDLDADASLTEAVAAFAAARRLNPGLVLAPLNLAYIHGVQASQNLRHGRDPLPAWQLAVAAYRDCLAIQADHPTALTRLAAVYSARAAHLAERDGDPAADLDAAVATLETLDASRDDHPEDGGRLGAAVLERSAWRARRGLDASGDLARAEELLTAFASRDAAAAKAAIAKADAVADGVRADAPAAARPFAALAEKLRRPGATAD